MELTLRILPEQLSVCQVPDYSQVDWEALPVMIGRTDEENSLVCPTDHLPANTSVREDGWRAMKIEGVLDFSLIGILAGIAGILAEEKIGIFVVSTFNTDYILVKQEHLAHAGEALASRGYTIIS